MSEIDFNKRYRYRCGNTRVLLGKKINGIIVSSDAGYKREHTTTGASIDRGPAFDLVEIVEEPQKPKEPAKWHTHAALMAEYAKDAAETDTPWERWEYRLTGGIWTSFKEASRPYWYESTEYRRKPDKPRTIRIGNFDVPEPLREEPEEGHAVFLVMPHKPSGFLTKYWLRDPELDLFVLNMGLLHSTMRAAAIHAEALRSLTSTKP